MEKNATDTDQHRSDILSEILRDALPVLLEQVPKYYEQIYRAAFQVTLLGLSGWIVLIGTQRISDKFSGNECWIYASIGLHVLALVLLLLIGFQIFVEARTALMRFSPLGTAIRDFKFAANTGTQDTKQPGTDSTSPRESLDSAIEKWEKYGAESLGRSKIFFGFGYVTMGILVISILVSSFTVCRLLAQW